MTLENRNILLVEDEIIVAFDMADILEAEGAHVQLASTLSAGLEAASDDFCVAVLDGNLRGQSVLPVAHKLADRNVPIVFCSAHLKMAGVCEAFPDALIVEKPVSPSDLVAVVAQAANETGRFAERESDRRRAAFG